MPGPYSEDLRERVFKMIDEKKMSIDPLRNNIKRVAGEC